MIRIRGRRLLVTTAVFVSLVVGAATALAGDRHQSAVIHVAPGDQIVVGINLHCFVSATTSIVCGGPLSAHLNAAIYSTGKVVLLAEPNARGAYPLLTAVRATCSNGQLCRLISTKP